MFVLFNAHVSVIGCSALPGGAVLAVP